MRRGSAETLARRDVAYVLIGALAARLHGFPRLTADTDITPVRDGDNLEIVRKTART